MVSNQRPSTPNSRNAPQSFREGLGRTLSLTFIRLDELHSTTFYIWCFVSTTCYYCKFDMLHVKIPCIRRLLIDTSHISQHQLNFCRFTESENVFHFHVPEPLMFGAFYILRRQQRTQLHIRTTVKDVCIVGAVGSFCAVICGAGGVLPPSTVG